MKRPKSDAVDLPDGPCVVTVTAPDRTVEGAADAARLALAMRDELVRMGRQDAIVVVLAPGQDVAALDATQMGQHGWIRRQDKQPNSPPTSLGSEQVPRG